jgi:hypothetical protein
MECTKGERLARNKRNKSDYIVSSRPFLACGAVESNQRHLIPLGTTTTLASIDSSFMVVSVEIFEGS